MTYFVSTSTERRIFVGIRKLKRRWEDLMDMKEFSKMMRKIKNQKKKKSYWPWIILGIVTTLIAICVAIWFYLRPEDDDWDDDFDDDWDEDDWDDDWDDDFEDDENIIAIDGKAYSSTQLEKDLEESMQTELEDGQDSVDDNEEDEKDEK